MTAVCTPAEIPRFSPDRLRAARTAMGMTQHDLARLVPMHGDALRRWEGGKSPIPAAALRRIAAALHLAPAQLQNPLPDPPTLSDLRTQIALTLPEAATRLAVRPRRLSLWEHGTLGTRGESAALLAATLGVSTGQITLYHDTGALPARIRARLAALLHVDRDAVQAAFDTARRRRHDKGLVRAP